MKNAPHGQGPFSVGEHYLLNVYLAAVAERYAADDPMRAKMEAMVRENIPALVNEGNRTEDLVGAFKRQIQEWEVWLSQKEAERDLAERATGIEANKKAIREAQAAGDEKRVLEEKVCFRLKWASGRDAKHPDTQRLLAMALEAGDQEVLTRMAKVLGAKVIKDHRDLEVDKVQLVMVLYWVKGPDGGVGFSRFTDQALVDYLNLVQKRNDLTLDSIRKTRQRLKLKKGPKPWVNKVERLPDGCFAVSLE